MSIDLKPCPFCGSKPHYNDRQLDFVSCSNEDCDLNDAEIVAAYWNTRYEAAKIPDQPVELPARIGKILDVYKGNAVHREDAIKGLLHWLCPTEREFGELHADEEAIEYAYQQHPGCNSRTLVDSIIRKYLRFIEKKRVRAMLTTEIEVGK